jgi:pyridoxal phosphate enzyme (YggS family)
MGIKENVEKTRQLIDEAARGAGRKPEEITLCAVSKFHALSAVEEAYAAGARVFGESRVQELYEKLKTWGASHADVELHMIGALQSNKVKKAVEVCNCVQSVDRGSLIPQLEAATAGMEKTLTVLFEVNGGEAAKGGYRDEAALYADVEAVLTSAHLRAGGLMTMAPDIQTAGEAAVRQVFRNTARLWGSLKKRYPEAGFETLSMGMSNDFKIAIEEGSSMVRIGTAIFGGRPAGGRGGIL